MSQIKHDLDHEVYLDPKDGKEHTNHGMLEYKKSELEEVHADYEYCLLYTSPSPRDRLLSRMPSSA